jgi:hypothetical protein
LKCIDAFGWNKDELLGNFTVLQMLKQTVDLRSQKINMEKIFDDAKIVQKNAEIIGKIKSKYQGFVTLLDLASELVENVELKEILIVPMYIIEESGIVP